MNNERLDAVLRAKQAYTLARSSLEARLRDQMKTELAKLQTEIDDAVRIAIDGGESKAAVLRALGTKNYHTINESLERSREYVDNSGKNQLDDVYTYADGILTVTYKEHGTARYSGTATFLAESLEGGVIVLMSQTPLWSDNNSVRNDVVVALDNRTEGEYYDEAISWLIPTILKGK